MSNLSKIVFVLITLLSLNMFGNNIAMSYDDESSSTVSENNTTNTYDKQTEEQTTIEGSSISEQAGAQENIQN